MRDNKPVTLHFEHSNAKKFYRGASTLEGPEQRFFINFFSFEFVFHEKIESSFLYKKRICIWYIHVLCQVSETWYWPLVELVRVAVVDSSSLSSVSSAGFMRTKDGVNTTTFAPWLARCRAQFTPRAPCRWGPHKKTTVGRWWSLFGTHLERQHHI